MRSYLVLLLLAPSALALVRINWNNDIDQEFEKLNSEANFLVPITKNNTLSIGPFLLSNGVFIGDNSLYRLGDATVKDHKNGTVHVDLTFGWRLLAVAFGKIQYQGRTMSGIFRAGNNEFHLTQDITNVTGSCSVHLRHFHLHELDKVSLQASLQEFDGMDLTEVVGKEIVPRLNEYFDAGLPRFQKSLEDDICRGIEKDPLDDFDVKAFGEFFKPKE